MLNYWKERHERLYKLAHWMVTYEKSFQEKEQFSLNCGVMGWEILLQVRLPQTICMHSLLFPNNESTQEKGFEKVCSSKVYCNEITDNVQRVESCVVTTFRYFFRREVG